MNIGSSEVTLNDLKDTKIFAEKLAEKYQENVVVALCRTLGTGKTTFAKFFIEALHGEQTNFQGSPTFTLVQEYHCSNRPTIYHFDWYRIKNATELKMIGWEEYYQNGAICLVEWADLFPSLLPQNTIYLNFEMQDGKRGVKLSVES